MSERCQGKREDDKKKEEDGNILATKKDNLGIYTGIDFLKKIKQPPASCVQHVKSLSSSVTQDDGVS